MSKLTQKMGYVSPLGKKSLFETPPDGEFHDLQIDIKAVLYRLGAAIVNNGIVNEDFPQEPIEIIGKRTKFDYKKFINPRNSYPQKNLWKHNGEYYFSLPFLNKKIAYLDKKQIFIRKEIISKKHQNHYHDNLVFHIYKPYENDSNVGSINSPRFDYLEKNAAIKLKNIGFSTIILILGFLKDGNTDREYLNKITNHVVLTVRKELLKNKPIYNIAAVVSELTQEHLSSFSSKELNKLYEIIILKKYIKAKEEKALLNIILALGGKNDFNPTFFLNRLLTRKIKGQTEFQHLYSRMHDYGGENSFSQMIILLYKIWYASDFKKADNIVYKNYTATTSLSYKQNKFLGFRTDDYDFSFDENTNIIIIPESLDPDSIPEIIINEVIQLFSKGEKYHPYQPLELVEISENKNEELLLDEAVPVPAFYLKAFDDKGAWENFEKNAWIALEVLATFSAIGNLSKLRLLLKLGGGKSGKLLIRLKFAFAIVEVTSGVLWIALNFINDCDNKAFCKSLRQYLFWLQICTLGVDVLSGRILRQQAREAKEALEAYRLSKKVKNADDLDVLEKHLDEIAKVADNVKPKKIYKLLVFTDAFGFIVTYNFTRKVFFYLDNLLKPNTQTIFVRGVEVFTGTKGQVKNMLRNAEKAYKRNGIIGVDDFFEGIGSKLSKRRLHSQTGELYIGTLVRKKEGSQYIYEIENFQYHTKKKWTRYDKVTDDSFVSSVSLTINPETGRKTILYADLYIPKTLNDAMQANKVSGLTDISLGKAMLNDGLAKLRKDIGKDIDGIYGEWIKSTTAYAEYGGESVNLTKLKEAMKGKEITEANLKIASFETVTGKWAKSKGFTNVKIQTNKRDYEVLTDINNLEGLEVIFTK